MQAQTPAGDGVRFVPTPARNGRGLVFGIAMAVAALAFGGFWLATGHIADALTWVCLGAGLVMLGIAWSIHRGDRTEMSFIVNSSGVARDAPERTTFTLPWKEVGASRLVHEHHSNTVWFGSIRPARGCSSAAPTWPFTRRRPSAPRIRSATACSSTTAPTSSMRWTPHCAASADAATPAAPR